MSDVTLTIDAETAKAIREMTRFAQKQREVERGTESAGRSARKSGAGFDRAVGGLRNYAAGLLSVGSAAGLAMKALSDLNAERNRSAGLQKEQERGMGGLAQLAAGDVDKLRRLEQDAKSLYAQGGATSLDAAANTVFSLESAGELSSVNRNLFGELYKLNIDPAVMARSLATLKTSMGAEETGGSAAIVSKALAASKVAPASADQLLEAAARSGVNAAALGLGDEEVLSGTALLSKAAGTPERAATQMNSLLASLREKGGFEGLSLAESVEKIRARGLSDKRLKKFLGREEAMSAYGVLSENLGEFRGLTADVDAAQRGDILGRTLQSRRALPAVLASEQARQGAAARELALRGPGVLRNQSEGAIDSFVAGERASGSSEYATWAREKALRGARYVMGDERFGERFGRTGDEMSGRVGEVATGAAMRGSLGPAGVLLAALEELRDLQRENNELVRGGGGSQVNVQALRNASAE